MKYIELFAGCGGLSLGLESAEFSLFFANELSPMAGETFAYNLLEEDLEQLAERKEIASKTLWINSNFRPDQLKARLSENPQLPPEQGKGHSDLGKTIEALNDKLLIGSITELNAFLAKSPKIARGIRSLDIELVSGGPPCQSFSLAGLRQHDNKRNTLPMDFADFVGHTKPKIAMLENVSGILRAFKLADGSKHYAWFEVARAFAAKGYIPLCLHVNAKNVGAAQNRPRFIMLAFRKDFFKKLILAELEPELKNALNCSSDFLKKEEQHLRGKGSAPEANKDLKYFDIEKHHGFFSNPVFSPLNTHKTTKDWNTSKDAIDDLSKNRYVKSRYSNLLDKELIETSGAVKPNNYESLMNHKRRANGKRVRMRFRLYQIISKAPNTIARDVFAFLAKPEEHDLKPETCDFLLSKEYLSSDDKDWQSFSKKVELIRYLKQLATKKQTQRALIANEPAPAALSIPDDACHYDQKEIRTLTVREMARFQSFPDWFVFRSKETTGGQMRKFQVPQYTQVGNAVPPLLGLALGKVVKNLLKAGKSS